MSHGIVFSRMIPTSDLLNALNDRQQEAVVHPAGPAIVLAGAGSGKTRVLTTRAAWLMAEQAAKPDSLLLVTFTNKAAGEMKERIHRMTGLDLAHVGTFHKICAQILRKTAPKIGLDPHFVIYDADDQLDLIKQIYKEHHFSLKDYAPRAVKSSISAAKNELVSDIEYRGIAQGQYQSFVGEIYTLYQQELLKAHALDFDDLLIRVVEILKGNLDVRQHFQQQFQHVLIDEYQDTNKAQYQLTKLLSAQHQNIYVVGDFSQSIYAWRGADYRNMMYLKTDFPDLTEYRLEQNYRSTQTILDAATSVIAQNTSHPILELWTENTQTDQIALYETNDSEEEAKQVVELIKDWRHEHDFSDMAILYRVNAQSRAFEEAFVRAGIPYRLVGGFKFYERKEIKDVLAMVRWMVNPADRVSEERLKKVGKRKFSSLAAWRDEKMSSEPQILQQPGKLIQELLALTEYQSRFDPKDPEDQSRLENIQELQNVALQFSDSSQFLENVALVQDDVMADLAGENSHGQVTMMSLHSAKGLEFEIVFMVGMEDGLLPHSRSLFDREQLEEERRLCYVGITRAKEKLVMSYARRRFLHGTATSSISSRFLQEIPQRLLKIESSLTAPSYLNQGMMGYRHTAISTPAPAAPTGRRLVIDEDSLDGVLSGDLSIEEFLKR